MATGLSLGIDFIMRKSKLQRDEALLYVRITVNSKRIEISLKEKINPLQWISKAEMVDGKGAEVKRINMFIHDVRSKLKYHYRQLEDKNQTITADMLKASYLGVYHLSKPKTKSKSLVELLDYFTSIWKDKMKQGGFKNYKTTIEYLKLFLARQYPHDDLLLSEVNMQIAIDIEFYIRNNPIKQHDKCNGNGLAKHMQRIKRILNWAVDIEWVKINPFQRYKCKLARVQRKKLSMQQIASIENANFDSERLQYCRDLFLFACYTGLAFVDVMQLKPSHLEEDNDGTIWSKIYRMKSGEFCAIPFLKKAVEIMNKYLTEEKWKKDLPVFPNITNQEINRCLKMFMEILGIPLNMTFHLARHSFAKTIALKNGVPLETVQMILGHSRITTTQMYANVDEEKIKGDLFNAEKRMLMKFGNSSNSI